MGMSCPKCGTPVNTRRVASSKTSEVGLVRWRFCECGASVVTVERVLDADIDGMLVEGLARGNGPGSDRSLVTQLAKRLGGSVLSLDS